MAQNRTSEILAILIGEPDPKKKVKEYTKLTRRLNRIAHKAWTWRYVQSVRMRTVAPSENFVCAVDELYCPKPKKVPQLPKWLRRVKRRIAGMAKGTKEDINNPDVTRERPQWVKGRQ